ncbi:MAG: DUF167 domain-containing protein [Candidatus Hodarchaeales archaeon]
MQEINCVQPDGQDVIIIVNVKTRQHLDGLFFEGDSISIKVKEPPIRGKANKKVVKILRKNFKTELYIEYGETSSIKKIRLKNISLDKVLKILAEKKV